MTQLTHTESASLKFEPSLRMEKRPGFQCCQIPNRDGATHCPLCGEPASPSTFHDAEKVVLTEPWSARLLFKMADWLLNMSKRIERMRR